jgi:hypothetical protein
MFDIDDDEDFIFLDDERGIVSSRKLFSRKRWADVARAINLNEIPPEMKKEIAALCIENLCVIISGPNEVSQRAALKKQKAALKKLISYLDEKLPANISKLLAELSSEEIVCPIKELLDKAEIVRIAAKTLRIRMMSKGGRPRNQTQLAHGLLDIYTKYTGRPIGLSRDGNNKPSGPCYRFLLAIFKGWISTKGLDGIITAKRDMAKTTHKKRT